MQIHSYGSGLEFRFSFALEWPQNLGRTQTDSLFVKIVKSCSGHPKTCKFVKNWKPKIFTIPTLFSYTKC